MKKRLTMQIEIVKIIVSILINAKQRRFALQTPDGFNGGAL